MSNIPIDDPRVRRRLWFTLHMLLFISVLLLQMLVYPVQPVLLVVHAALLVTLSLHLFSLMATELDTSTPEPVPLNVKPGAPQLVRVDNVEAEQNFWYHWHDVGTS